MADLSISAVYDSSSVAETGTNIATVNCIGPFDGVSVAESITTPTFALKLYRGTNSVTVSLITMDWSFIEVYRNFKLTGIPLKGIIFMPGSGAPDTFVIKDGDENGSYLYAGALSANTVVVYPGSMCRPFIDFSECTLTTGHKVTFVW